jgi:uncharacterized protein
MADKKEKKMPACSELSKPTIYFTKGGEQNTKRTLQLGLNRAKQLGIKTVLVPSTSGKSGVAAVEVFKNKNMQIVVVTHHFGFKEKGKWEMDPKHVEALTKGGACIFAASHALSGVERSFRGKFQGISLVEAIGQTLKHVFGQGIKVAIEISLMCADAGFAPADDDILAFGGTGTGLDTAVILRPAHMNSLFDLKVKEIIAMPRDH